ncbi:hypothetical protein DPEC_G00207770 [Dallia pectoralis]|uniref:Uncharacterized protein n=1 Tax=Dallia pectoralis TaxID=75939 RepID=A0ACC2G5A9_DALPE|nr:hypothetical protein DPEC_G00207770 [Dallia pectoralis]
MARWWEYSLPNVDTLKQDEAEKRKAGEGIGRRFCGRVSDFLSCLRIRRQLATSGGRTGRLSAPPGPLSVCATGPRWLRHAASEARTSGAINGLCDITVPSAVLFSVERTQVDRPWLSRRSRPPHRMGCLRPRLGRAIG